MGDKQIRLLSTGGLQVPQTWINEAKGIRLDVIPFIRIEERTTPALVRQIREWSEETYTVIFTSKQAVRIVAGILSHTPPWRIYCINGATKREILTWWKDASIVESAPNGKELAGKILAAEKTAHVLFFCSSQRMDEIPSRLQAAQMKIKEIHIYETIPTPSLVEKEYQAIFFFSPSAVHSFFSLNRVEEGLFFSIGATTTAALEKYIEKKENIITAARPSKYKMLEAAIQYFQKQSDEQNNA